MSDPAYDQAWRRFRTVTRFLRIAESLWLVLLAFLVLSIALLMFVTASVDWRGELSVFFVALLALVVATRIAADVAVKTFRCPRCGKPFVRLSILQRGPLYSIKHRYPCQHCRLPVGAVSGDVDRAAA